MGIAQDDKFGEMRNVCRKYGLSLTYTKSQILDVGEALLKAKKAGEKVGATSAKLKLQLADRLNKEDGHA